MALFSKGVCHVKGNVRDIWGKRGRGILVWEEVWCFYIQFFLGSAKESKLKTWKSWSPTRKIASYGAMLGAMCGMYGGKEVRKILFWEEVLYFYIQFFLGSAKESKLKTWKSSSPTQKIASYGAMLGAMCGIYGGKEVGKILFWEEVLYFYIQFFLGSAKELKLKTWKSSSPTQKIASYGAMLGAMCGIYGGKEVGKILVWEEVLYFYIQFFLGSAKEFKLKTWKSSSPTQKIASYGAMLGAMCGIYGGKEVGKILVWEEVWCFYIQFFLGSAKEFKLKTWKSSSLTQKIASYGAMLGAMCGIYGGKEVGKILVWEEMQYFYIQFFLGSAKEFQFKTWKSSSPTRKRDSYGAMLGANVRDMWGKRGRENIGLGGSAVLLHSVFPWVGKGIETQNLKIFEPHPQNSFVWCHVRGNVRDIWGKRRRENIHLGGNAVLLHSVCFLGKFSCCCLYRMLLQKSVAIHHGVQSANIDILAVVFSVKIVIKRALKYCFFSWCKLVYVAGKFKKMMAWTDLKRCHVYKLADAGKGYVSEYGSFWLILDASQNLV